MQATNISWSQTERHIAELAFNKAYERETSFILQGVREQARTISELEDLWRLNDFLSARRHDLEGKYDFQESSLIFIFAGLIKEKWLTIEELEGLASDKLAKISVLSKM
ncbi:hypothetical protein [Myxosarcina sp. GI1(2024)]